MLLLDVGISPITYYALSLAGFSSAVSLLGGTIAAALRVLAGFVWQRRFDGLTGFMLFANVVSLAVSFVSGDELVLLLRDPLITALIALAFVGSCFTRSPAMYVVAKRFRVNDPAVGAAWDATYARDPLVRRHFVVSTAVWGVGLFTEAAIRATLVGTLPVSAAVGAGPVVEWSAIALIVAGNAWYRRRHRIVLPTAPPLAEPVRADAVATAGARWG